MEFLKKPVFTINGFTLTVGLLIVLVILAWFFMRKRR